MRPHRRRVSTERPMRRALAIHEREDRRAIDQLELSERTSLPYAGRGLARAPGRRRVHCPAGRRRPIARTASAKAASGVVDVASRASAAPSARAAARAGAGAAAACSPASAATAGGSSRSSAGQACHSTRPSKDDAGGGAAEREPADPGREHRPAVDLGGGASHQRAVRDRLLARVRAEQRAVGDHVDDARHAARRGGAARAARPP